VPGTKHPPSRKENATPAYHIQFDKLWLELEGVTAMSILGRVRNKLGNARALRSLALAAVAVAALSAVGAAPALAQERHWRGDGYRHHDRGWVNWRGGHWFRGPHEGRLGWWWIAGNAWYYYTAPVYPYPAYVPPAPALYYYYGYPAGYYPYVHYAVRWRPVPRHL